MRSAGRKSLNLACVPAEPWVTLSCNDALRLDSPYSARTFFWLAFSNGRQAVLYQG